MPSYYSASSGVENVQLQVQEVCVKLTDSNILTTSGSTATIDFSPNTIQQIRLATFFDDSAGTNAPVKASDQSYTADTSTSVTFTLSAAMAAADCLTVKFIVTP